jgi:integrase
MVPKKPPTTDPRALEAAKEELRANFTETNLRKITPAEKDYFVFAKKIPGLGVRVGRNGAKWFTFQRRQEGGRPFRKSIGQFPGVTLAVAVKRTQQLMGEQAGGHDLHEKFPSRRVRRAAKAGAKTFGDLLELFVKDKTEEGARPNYIRPLERRVRRLCESLLPRPAESILLEELEALWESIEGKPSVKRILPVELRTVFRWSLRKRRIAHNPMAGVFLPKAPDPRDRYLNGEQMRVVFAEAEKLVVPRRQYVQLLMMLLVRRTELARAKWSEFSPDRSEWELPAERMKGGKRSHFVPVPPAAREILKSLPTHANCDWVFTFDGKHACVDVHTQDRLNDILAEKSLPSFTLHDFRRSGPTWLARQGTDDVTIDMLLAHKARGKVAGTYNLHAREAERRAALELLSAFLTGGTNEPIVVSAPLKQLTGPSDRIPRDGEAYESLQRENELLRRELEIADQRNFWITRIAGHPDWRNFKTLVGQRKHPAPKSAHYGTELLAFGMVDVLVDMIAYGVERIWRPEIEMLRNLWVARRDRKRASGDETAANQCDDWIEGADQVLNLISSGTLRHPAALDRVWACLLENLTTQLFTSGAPILATKLVKMATGRTGLTRGQTRRLPKNLMLAPPAD